MNKVAIMCLITSYSTLTFSAVNPRSITCPGITNDASTIINSIQNLKNQLKPAPECQGVVEKLSLVSEITQGKEWEKINQHLKEGKNFEGDELKKVAELTEKSSIALNDIVGLVSNNRNCIDKKNRASFMANLSGVVKEVSTIVGNATGPYGVAVSLGGTILSSAITGIDKYYKANHPYEFKNPDEELLFMNQFCSYVEIQKDINDYLNLEVRPEELGTLEKYFDIKQKDLEDNCPECHALVVAWKTQEASDLILKRITSDANIVALGNDQTHSNYTRCNEINRAIYSNNSDLNQFFNLLDEYNNPMSSASDLSLIKDIVASSKDLPLIYPKLTTCWSLPTADKQKISQDFNNFLRDDIIPLGSTLFGQQVESFKQAANKKYVNPLGEYTENTLLRRKWMTNERGIVQGKLNDPNYDSSVQLIIEHKKKLEERIFDHLLVDYLQFLTSRNTKHISHFEKNYKKFISKSLKDYSTILKTNVSSVDDILAGLKKNPNIDKRPFLSLLKDQKYELDLIITQTSTLDRYCHFMNYMLLTTNQTKKTCDSGKEEILNLYNEVISIDQFTKEYISKKLVWLEVSDNYQSSRVKDYSIHLQNWIERGDERWAIKK